MIKIEKIKVEGWEPAIRGMRNPLDSWEKSDSIFGVTTTIGPNDMNLMMKLAKSGTEHSKYRRMIVVWMDITAPLYWWKEFDTYKVGTVADSCSTMHTIHKREFTLDDFSCEHLGYYNPDTDQYEIVEPVLWNNNEFNSTDELQEVIDFLNEYRKRYLATKDKRYWWQLIQLLPSSYNQKRTVMLNYEVLANIYRQRRNHKLDEWHIFCKMIDKGLPYSQLITLKDTEIEKEADNICNLVMNNASENDIKEAVEHSMQVIDDKKRVEEKERLTLSVKALHNDGFSNSDIAEIFGMAESSVRSILKED